MLGKQYHILLGKFFNKFIALLFLVTLHLQLCKYFAVTIYLPRKVMQWYKNVSAEQDASAVSRLRTSGLCVHCNIHE
jgi:hypothetical protein